MSTDKQAEAGLSLEAQTAKIHAMAHVRDVGLSDVLVDAGASAKSLDRPQMLRLLDLVDAGHVDMVIIAKLDRLTRSLVDLADLLARFERRRVALVSVEESLNTHSATGRAVINLIVLMSQWERETGSERTRDALQHKRANGERVGTLPLGFQLGADRVHLEPAPAEQRLLARMRELRADGQSTREIAANLTAEGATTRKGTPWRFQYVAHALRKPAVSS